MSLLVNTGSSPFLRGPAPAHSAADADALVAHVRRELGGFGFDVVEPSCLGWYNDAIPADLGARIPPLGRQGQKALTLLVGNTRKLWELFLEACKCDSALLNCDNPLDSYVERAIGAVVGTPSPGSQPRCFWAHKKSDDLEGGSGYVAVQRMASAIGLAYLDPSSHLCLHPKYGPWFALRCVLVFDEVEYQGRRGPVLPCPLDHTTQEYVRMAMRSAERASSCELAGKQSNWDAVKCQWHKWVAVREAPCPGNPWRYSPEQLEYHYTRNKTLLASALRERAKKARSSPPPMAHPRFSTCASDSGLSRSAPGSRGGSPPLAWPPRGAAGVKTPPLGQEVAGVKTPPLGQEGKAGRLRAALSRLTGGSHGPKGMLGIVRSHSADSAQMAS